MAHAPCSGALAATAYAQLSRARITIAIVNRPLSGALRGLRHVSTVTNGVLLRGFTAGTGTQTIFQGFDVSAASPMCTTSGATRTCTLATGLPPGSFDFTVATYDVVIPAEGVVPSAANPLDQGGLTNQTVTRGVPVTLTIPLGKVSGSVFTLAGQPSSGFVDALGSAAKFNTPADIAVDANQTLYVVEDQNHSVRKIAVDGTVATLAGSGVSGFTNGTGSGAQFNQPNGVAVDATGGNVYVADTLNNAIRQVTSSGVVTSRIPRTTRFARSLRRAS